METIVAHGCDTWLPRMIILIILSFQAGLQYFHQNRFTVIECIIYVIVFSFL